jgi:TIR domain-containing protein
MSTGLTKPIIFISYAHADEPEKPSDGEIQWLSFVRRFLQPAVKDGIFDLWVDRHMMGGADWDPEIKQKLCACDIFILLVSANSMASDYIVDKEIAIIRERQAKGDDVHFYPLLLTPTPDAGLDKIRDKNLRPPDAQPFSGFSYHDRLKHMTEAANEIPKITQQIVERKGARQPSTPSVRTAYVHITGLPETAYERLAGRKVELKRLDEAWADAKTTIISLVAEGGAGKSSLVNEWLEKMQADNYRGAEAVLGWSFYSQGSKERATSADAFLNWAVGKLGIGIDTTSASAKGEAIAEAMTKRRVLLVLDGVEPLQHGPGPQTGQLKDLGLRALLCRFAAVSPAEAHGIVLLTSRLAITDIARWKNSAAPVVDVENLSDEAGAALLRDNGVWGTDRELKASSHDFGGHPLALGLLASFLKETQFGDVRRRDHIRAFFADPESPRYDHAKRVMESFEKEWLDGQPVLLAIMHMVGLFDRPASDGCLKALRKKPAIEGLTDKIVKLDDAEWQRAATRLREVRLLAPLDPSSPGTLDAHSLVREWFGAQLRRTNEKVWRAAHFVIYDHLRRTTREGDSPTLEQLAPLYQAISHGCQADSHHETLHRVYIARVCRRLSDGRLAVHSKHMLGAFGADLAALSWFFAECYETPLERLDEEERLWLLGEAAWCLTAQGRFREALHLMRKSLPALELRKDWHNATIRAANLSDLELLTGNISGAIESASKSVSYADKSNEDFHRVAPTR